MLLFLGYSNTMPWLVQAYHLTEGFSCKSAADCKQGWEECVSGDAVAADTGHCVHKGAFPMNVLEYWGYIFVLLWLWLSNMGGIGGGGVVVPISMIFF